MSDKLLAGTALALLCTVAGQAQNTPGQRQSVPIYQVTVIERTVKAVNYQYRNGPTRIDFRGTVLLPHAKGEATVESKTGRTEIAAKFERVEPATRFGPEYLTYVLWAITPEGHAKNLGEVLADSSNHAHLQVTADFQTFGLIVTAEPYAAVRQPSDVVVIENEIRPDTIGRTELIQAKYELLPRGHYTYNVPPDVTAAAGNGEKLPMDRYEALLEVYQAQNAVQIARAQGADRYAADTFAKAEQSLRQAREFYDRKVDRSTVVTSARAAAQTAEDARTISAQRKRDEELALARSEAAREQQLRAQAEAEAQRARSQASADRSQLEQERAIRQRVEADAAIVTAPAQPPPPPQTVIVEPVAPPDTSKTELRVQMLRELSSAMPARDTPRGLVVTVADTDFHGGVELNSDAASRLARVASVLASRRGLFIAIEGHGDRFSSERAAIVRSALARSGAPMTSMSAQGFGTTRPIGPAGRPENRRVEIVISGDALGNAASWDRTYQIAPRQ